MYWQLATHQAPWGVAGARDESPDGAPGRAGAPPPGSYLSMSSGLLAAGHGGWVKNTNRVFGVKRLVPAFAAPEQASGWSCPAQVSGVRVPLVVASVKYRGGAVTPRRRGVEFGVGPVLVVCA
jgi:hypothetical protein